MSEAPPGRIPLERPDPIVCVEDIAFVRFEKPDLDRQERFLADFGLVRTHRTEDALYMRGSGPAHHVYAAARGPVARFVGAAFRAATRADLDTLARATGAPVAAIDEPGGGERVVLRDPAGFRVEVVHGIEELAPLPPAAAPPRNGPGRPLRVDRPVRPPRRPAQVARIGHVVLQATRFRESADWYMRHLGLIPTDVQCLDDGSPNLAFLRCDRGDRPSDHHTVVVFGGIADAYAHSAYECADLDDVGMGQQVLRAAGWKHVWGIGRHLLGSQIFDYWRDPDGDELEHFADGDCFTAGHPTGYHPFDPSLLWMWGADLPRDFGPKLTPALAASVAGAVLRGRLSLSRLKLLKRSAARPARPWLAARSR
jgi:hypothetical protein